MIENCSNLVLISIWLVGVLISCDRLTRHVRWIRDLRSCRPGWITFLYAPFVLPSIAYGLVETIRRRRVLGVRGKGVPKCTDPVLMMSAVELSHRIKSGQLTSIELLEKCIVRMREVNPIINAIVAPRIERAREEARRCDRLVQQRDPHAMRSQLWGVPCVVKECFEVPHMPFTSGVLSRARVRGEKEASVIERVRRNGLIVLGVTNTSEACMFHESNNPIYGLTRNPFDTGRTAGGSSGGCAAAVASCIVPISVTSDVGGSTRIPALYQGLYGHKASGGLTPNTSTYPKIPCDSLMSRYCQIGPTTRYAQDLRPLQRLLAGPDGIDQLVRSSGEIKLDGERSSSIRTIFDLPEPFQTSFLSCTQHRAMREAHRRVVNGLLACFPNATRHRTLVISQDLPELAEAFDICKSTLICAIV